MKIDKLPLFAAAVNYHESEVQHSYGKFMCNECLTIFTSANCFLLQCVTCEPVEYKCCMKCFIYGIDTEHWNHRFQLELFGMWSEKLFKELIKIFNSSIACDWCKISKMTCRSIDELKAIYHLIISSLSTIVDNSSILSTSDLHFVKFSQSPMTSKEDFYFQFRQYAAANRINQFDLLTGIEEPLMKLGENYKYFEEVYQNLFLTNSTIKFLNYEPKKNDLRIPLQFAYDSTKNSIETSQLEEMENEKMRERHIISFNQQYPSLVRPYSFVSYFLKNGNEFRKLKFPGLSLQLINAFSRVDDYVNNPLVKLNLFDDVLFDNYSNEIEDTDDIGIFKLTPTDLEILKKEEFGMEIDYSKMFNRNIYIDQRSVQLRTSFGIGEGDIDFPNRNFLLMLYCESTPIHHLELTVIKQMLRLSFSIDSWLRRENNSSSNFRSQFPLVNYLRQIRRVIPHMQLTERMKELRIPRHEVLNLFDFYAPLIKYRFMEERMTVGTNQSMESFANLINCKNFFFDWNQYLDIWNENNELPFNLKFSKFIRLFLKSTTSMVDDVHTNPSAYQQRNYNYFTNYLSLLKKKQETEISIKRIYLQFLLHLFNLLYILSAQVPSIDQILYIVNLVMLRIGIVGGGLSGLSSLYAATSLLRNGQIDLYEKSSKIGGWTNTYKLEGNDRSGLFELGAHTIRCGDGIEGRRILNLFQNLSSSSSDILTISKKNKIFKNRYILHENRPVLIERPSLFSRKIFGESMFSLICREISNNIRGNPFEKCDDTSVRDLCNHIFGANLTSNVIDAALSGIYAGDIDRLSARATIPNEFGEHLLKTGSLLRGMRRVKRKNENHSTEISEQIGSKYNILTDVWPFADENILDNMDVAVWTMEKGLSELTNILLKKSEENCLKNGIKLKILKNCQIESIEKNSIHSTNCLSENYDLIISAINSRELSRLIIKKNRKWNELSHSLNRIHSTNMIVSCLEFDEPLKEIINEEMIKESFGYLVPSSRNESTSSSSSIGVLGVIFDSFIFPSQDRLVNKKERGRLTILMGGRNHFDDLWKNYRKSGKNFEEYFRQFSLNSIKSHQVIKTDKVPVFSICNFYENAIPQYDVGYRTEILPEISSILKSLNWSSILLNGNSFNNIGVTDTIYNSILSTSNYLR
ncbi:hypothetical protein SNEBB_001560 [Seison nebaliae]|nr:hypothetical protein SNEBB_001560 [Seison nebaliae]